MLKKFIAIVFIALTAAGIINAQSVNRSEYEETTLSNYEIWLNQAEVGDAKKFRASVLFSMQSETTFYFTDLNEGSFTGFNSGKDWSSLQADQPVVIYFTATGSLTRVIDDIDYATASATSRVPAASTPPSTMPRVPPLPASSGTTVTSAAPRARAAAKLTGSIPQRGSAKIYRLQIGSYLVSANAVRVFNQLRDEGLRPAYEKYGNYTRVVLSGIRANDVSRHAEEIGALGFAEIWCREER
jgi:hypothetical protein